MYLCCDLGGTVADWGVFDPNDESFIFRTELDVSEHEDFYEMMDYVLAEYDKYISSENKISITTLGIAGPTNYSKVRVTNIEGWEIKSQTTNAILEDHGHAGVTSIVNDFEALGYGVLYLLDRGFDKEDIVPVYGRFKSGPARVGEERGARSIVCGPGTGLGIASIIDDLFKDGFPYIVSSEGGHHSLAPENAEQYRYLSHANEFSGKKSYEQVLSHLGLQNTYNYFRREYYSAEPNYGILSKEIILLATSGKDQAATDTIELFCEILANFCGNSVLTFNCDKAIFLWGGVLLDLPIDLIKTRFKRHYFDRCSHDERVSRVPVVLLQNKDIPLLGCAHRSTFEAEKLKQ